ncbi:multicopper oxidase family protein [Chengkuizengella axinellae]|uniref:Multicopper oxidase family protein n=1 Tax=Chengkuizengella axinellae TaxID=3064388 RepID=A0ABT9J6F1_9BACL|nr:multicopper oxidase family protein [Chengkuizengella sp. 2205SS18-9]MDP5277048.1 multicopper oxidase family protein [Chengkuizengella sp. 2205SS18-9]
MKYIITLLILVTIIGIIASCQVKDQNKSAGLEGISILDIPLEKPEMEEKINFFELVAKKATWNIKGESIEAWTYNGTVPGEEIRVIEGEWVEVNLKNELDEPVTIHWHGMVLPNVMDGVAGVTQNAIQPGESFTYQFKALEAGTYWYHSHQNGFEQVDRGLYGAFIVEPKEKSYDKDYVLMLDEWDVGENNRGMMNSMMGDGSTPGEMDSQMMYQTFTVNGKSAPNINPIDINAGEIVRLRIINAGYQKHVLYLNDHSYRIAAIDGKEVEGNSLTTDVFIIAPGERIDLEFTETGTMDWFIDSPNAVEEAKDILIPVNIAGVEEENYASYRDASQLKIMDISQQGKMDSIIDPNQEPDIEYTMDLSAGMGMMQGGMTYTINGETFPDTEPIQVKKGDLVKVRITNNSMLDHPMHLHGHYFQVISKNGLSLENPLVKDLINVEPHEQYEILFIADNPGDWLFHCHDLLHATGGMVTAVKYNGYYSSFELGGEYHNEPE